ncbi:MAG: hypothetical protein IBX69_02140 [Anaerolineales bacterium]|nr:hypothetical protein [Anaerolineales bacterium]
MERTVPSTVSEEIELYLRTYYSLLRSSAEVQIRSLEEVHMGMHSLLHPDARNQFPDLSAFIYCLLRLPQEIDVVELVILGQSNEVFTQEGWQDIQTWVQVFALARRRRYLYNGLDTLACFIASRTDIDDIIPMLTAYQIEWNKMHALLKNHPIDLEQDMSAEPSYIEDLAQILHVSASDLEQLRIIWGSKFGQKIKQIKFQQRRLRVRLLSGSLTEYNRATRLWWEKIERTFPELKERPVYFVSSNSHSIVNLISGYAWQNTEILINYLNEAENKALKKEWDHIQAEKIPSSQENFLYYALKKFQQTSLWSKRKEEHIKHEEQCGIVHVPSAQNFNVHAQIIDLSKVRKDFLDSRLNFLIPNETRSNALIFNIDYPLGLGAYNILSRVAEHVCEILGVYIMGKAASLNGVIGDILVPNVVHDEQSKNTYLFNNCFSTAEISPFLIYGTVLDNQKSVTVRGTFLQNAEYMEVFYREGYTDIEMEAGPYLSAVYEMFRPKRHPVDEIVNLYELPFDLGIIHYVSDTPMSKGRNLGAGSLSYFGVDSTYAASLAILQRIFDNEAQRLQR